MRELKVSQNDVIKKLTPTVVVASPRTKWVVVEIETDTGVVGVGEAFLSGSELVILKALDILFAQLYDLDPSMVSWQDLQFPGKPGGLIVATAMSAMAQAVMDLKAQLVAVPAWRLLGDMRRDRIPLYANINRGTTNRTPDGFAARARQAVAEGFRAVKCAPFDEVTRPGLSGPEGRKAISAGIERVARVRAAVGESMDIMVDCHWRFDVRSAKQIVRELEPLGLAWLEDPLPESDLPAWRKLRDDCSIPLAGGERFVSLAEFVPFLENQVLDVVCPDVRFVGGMERLRDVGVLAEAYDTGFSPHNPGGPVGTIASAQVCATVRNLVWLEYQWNECAWRSDLVCGREVLDAGYLTLPAATGLGLTMDSDVAALHKD